VINVLSVKKVEKIADDVIPSASSYGEKFGEVVPELIWKNWLIMRETKCRFNS
jgi:hypothetical protein